MAPDSVHDTYSPAEFQEKDLAEGDEKIENAEGIQSPASDQLTAKNRTALTRLLLLKLDIRYVLANGPENPTLTYASGSYLC